MSDVEKRVRNFYDNFGWQKSPGDDAKAGEDILFRQFTSHYYAYHDLVNLRTKQCFSGHTGNLLIAGGGDLPETHCEIARQFSSVCCLDISRQSLHISNQKLGENSDNVLGSILNLPMANNYSDAVYCAHVISHIDRQLQSRAIRELLRVMRPSGRAVIICRNPRSVAGSIRRIKSKLLLIRRRPNGHGSTDMPSLYYHAHPLK